MRQAKIARQPGSAGPWPRSALWMSDRQNSRTRGPTKCPLRSALCAPGVQSRHSGASRGAAKQGPAGSRMSETPTSLEPRCPTEAGARHARRLGPGQYWRATGAQPHMAKASGPGAKKKTDRALHEISLLPAWATRSGSTLTRCFSMKSRQLTASAPIRVIEIWCGDGVLVGSRRLHADGQDHP